MKYPLSDVDMGEEEAHAVADVVRSKWLSAGPRTEEFESRFAETFGVRHAIAVANCTAALHLSLMACGIKPGDEVLVPSYTFVASANAILYQGAKPVFVDISGAHDLNLNIKDLEAKITPNTTAIIPVHLGGYACEMHQIINIAERYGLAVIEDACHAIGADYRSNPRSRLHGRKLGTLGNAGCFSFFANKNLVTGEGGMIVTNDDHLAEKARLSRSHGMTKSSWDKAAGRAVDYDISQLGYNYRSTEITAALGLIQLSKLPKANLRRRHLTRGYQKCLADCPNVILPFVDREDDSGYHIFPIVLAEASARASFRQFLNEHEIQTSVHYPPVHLFSQYRDICPNQNSLSMTTNVSSREVTVPLHPLLSDSDIDAIADKIWLAASKSHETRHKI